MLNLREHTSRECKTFSVGPVQIRFYVILLSLDWSYENDKTKEITTMKTVLVSNKKTYYNNRLSQERKDGQV